MIAYNSDSVTAWICVDVNGSELGAVPLSQTQSLVNNGSSGEENAPRLLSGFGQLQADLNIGDTITLKVFIESGQTGSIATIASNQISPGTPAGEFNSGGTLSISRISG
jgi:hypothetical protein